MLNSGKKRAKRAVALAWFPPSTVSSFTFGSKLSNNEWTMAGGFSRQRQTGAHGSNNLRGSWGSQTGDTVLKLSQTGIDNMLTHVFNLFIWDRRVRSQKKDWIQGLTAPSPNRTHKQNWMLSSSRKNLMMWKWRTLGHCCVASDTENGSAALLFYGRKR